MEQINEEMLCICESFTEVAPPDNNLSNFPLYRIYFHEESEKMMFITTNIDNLIQTEATIKKDSILLHWQLITPPFSPELLLDDLSHINNQFMYVYSMAINDQNKEYGEVLIPLKYQIFLNSLDMKSLGYVKVYTAKIDFSTSNSSRTL